MTLAQNLLQRVLFAPYLILFLLIVRQRESKFASRNKVNISFYSPAVSPQLHNKFEGLTFYKSLVFLIYIEALVVVNISN